VTFARRWRVSVPFLELHLRLSAAEQPAVEAALERQGSLAITLLDAEDVPILEPGVGETPLWPELILTALFDVERDPIDVLAGLDGEIPELVLKRAKFAILDDKDWTRAWMDSFAPMRFGQKLWIVPTTMTPPDPAAINIRLDPGLAFGSGTHPTTALCLEWLDGLDLRGKTVLDFGCGSGILALAALKLGAARAYALDNDPQALLATRENAVRNAVADRLVVLSERDALPAPCDVLLANILLPPLLALAPTLQSAVRAGGLAAFSGMLAGQEREFIPRYAAAFVSLSVTQQGDWIRIDGQRSGA
jgi:ribosomal protein L11 methyltransferase